MSGQVDFLIVPSNDGDMLLYPGTTDIIYRPSFRPKNKVWGLLVSRDLVLRRRTNVKVGKATVTVPELTDTGLLLVSSMIGTDYASVRNIGAVKALKAIGKWTGEAASLEAVLLHAGVQAASMPAALKVWFCVILRTCPVLPSSARACN